MSTAFQEHLQAWVKIVKTQSNTLVKVVLLACIAFMISAKLPQTQGFSSVEMLLIEHHGFSCQSEI